MLSSLFASPSYLSFDSSGGLSFYSRELSFALNSGGLTIKGRHLLFGDATLSGLIRTLNNPYSYDDISFGVGSMRESSRIAASIVKYKNLDLITLTGERYGLGLSYEGRWLALSTLYLSDGKSDEGPIINYKYSGTKSFTALALSAELPFLELSSVLSYMRESSFDIFVRSKLLYRSLSLEFRVGEIPSIIEKDHYYKASFSIRYRTDGGSYIEYGEKFGDEAVYEGEFNSRERKLSSRFVSSTFAVKGASSYTVSGKARSWKHSLEFDIDQFSFGFSSSSGYYFSYKLDDLRLGYKSGAYYISLDAVFNKPHFEVKLSAASSKLFEVTIKLFL